MSHNKHNFFIENALAEYTFLGDISTCVDRLNNVTNGCLGYENFPIKKSLQKSNTRLYIGMAVATIVVVTGLCFGLAFQKSEHSKIKPCTSSLYHSKL